MKLAYITQPTDLGGSAVPDCGTIHRSEIKRTLDNLSSELSWPVNFNDCLLGSTGKREYSGDIDLVIDLLDWDIHNITGFRTLLENRYGKSSVARNGAMLHLRYPIADYNSDLDDVKPRTGFVQIDFNFGNKDWEKFYHSSPGEDSAYKGAHRNLIIAAITSVFIIEKSDETDTFNRPIQLQRWKWGSNGFILVERTSQRDKHSNIWMRKQNDEIIDGPFMDPEFIAQTLFIVDGTAEDFYSLETIIAAVKRNYGMVDQERIWKRTARNFSEWSQGKLFTYPAEISRYFLVNDK
jgi:hypothetical protein